MRLRDNPGWLLNHESSSEVDFALYVRDACRVTTSLAASIPRLEPAVAVDDVPASSEIAARWDRWWAQSIGLPAAQGGAEAVVNHSDMDLLAHFQRLRPVYAEWARALRSTQNPPTRDLVPFHAAVDEVAQELEVERADLDFALTIREIPVKGKFWHRVNTDTVLASSELLRSSVVIVPLIAVIRELASPQ